MPSDDNNKITSICLSKQQQKTSLVILAFIFLLGCVFFLFVHKIKFPKHQSVAAALATPSPPNYASWYVIFYLTSQVEHFNFCATILNFFHYLQPTLLEAFFPVIHLFIHLCIFGPNNIRTQSSILVSAFLVFTLWFIPCFYLTISIYI